MTHNMTEINTKYHEALRLTDLCVATIQQPDDSHFYTAWDDLFTFIHANFARPETYCEDPKLAKYDHAEIMSCVPLMGSTYKPGSPELEALIRSIPPQLLDIVWPVGVARYVLGKIAGQLNLSRLTTFMEFYHRYGTMITSASERSRA